MSSSWRLTSSHTTSTRLSKPCRRSHSSHTRSTTGSTLRRMAAISLVRMSACWLLIRSVVDQLSPSRKGGMPVRATSCSKIWRTGTWLSRMGPSAPMTRMSTSPATTKSRRLPSRPACMAADHSRATRSHRSWAAAPFSPLHTTAKRIAPARSQLAPTVWKIFMRISARKGMLRSRDTP